MNLEKLKEMREQYKPQIDRRRLSADRVYVDEVTGDSLEVLICSGAVCSAMKSDPLAEKVTRLVQDAGLSEKVHVHTVGCMGLCSEGPHLVVYPQGVHYNKMNEEKAERIVSEHLAQGNVVADLVYEGTKDNDRIKVMSQSPFYKEQIRIAMKNCGTIQLESLEEYIGAGGYEGLAKAITEMTVDEVLEEVKISNIRGRGGAAFPAWRKWNTSKRYPSDQKFIVCNADEGNPGATMDRALMEGDPHSILEGMAIAGYTVGATKGFIYVRGEYPVAIERLRKAIAQANENGLLGNNILGTNFSFDIQLRLGAGAFVCGESTALMESIEGKRGMPRPKIFRSAEKGLWGKPTVLNNVETLSNIPDIIRNGGAWYASFGTELSTGTKVFSLDGKTVNTGVVEIPMGSTVEKIVFDIGGGIKKGKKFKAVLTGGPAGGCVPAKYMGTPLDFDSLAQHQSILGSGDMIVLDENACMVDVARYFMDFSVEESCGKCVPCREGCKRMLEILEGICEGKGQEGDIERLESLADTITSASLCGLGQAACTPVFSTLLHYRDEYEAHIKEKRCPAGRCKGMNKKSQAVLNK